MKELNLDEMEMINGGSIWDRVAGCGFAGAILGFGAVSLTIAAMTTPVGWAATGTLLLGATAAGATVGGGIGAAGILEEIILRCDREKTPGT